MATTATLRGQGIVLGGGSIATAAFVATGGGILVAFSGGYADEGTIPTAITVSGHGGTWVNGTTFISNTDSGLQSFGQMFYNSTYTTASAAVTSDPNNGSPITNIWVAEVLADGALTFDSSGQASGTTTAAQSSYSDADNSASIALYGIVYFIPQSTNTPINSATKFSITENDGAGIGTYSGGYRLGPGTTKTYGATLASAPTRFQAHVLSLNEAGGAAVAQPAVRHNLLGAQLQM